jgi:hypothetical protein
MPGEHKEIGMRESTAKLLLVMVLGAAAAGCASMPTPKILVPTNGVSAEQVSSLGQASGSVVDVLSTDGEETYLLLESVTGGALTGRPIDVISRDAPEDRKITIPVNEAALVYYVKPASSAATRAAAAKAVPTGEPRPGFPVKNSYPELPSAGSSEAKLSCADLDAELSRTEAVRWFARNEGLMGYTPTQVLAHHAATTAIVIGVTVLVVGAAGGGGAAGFGGGGFNFSGSGPTVQPDPAGSLRDQVGAGQLRWAITAADVRVAGLLRIKRDKGCAGRSTLVDDASDLRLLQQFDGLREGAQRLSGVALLHEQTRLLDMLGPRPLPEGRLADCSAFHCDNSVDQGETSVTVVELRGRVPELADEHVQRIFGNAVWYGETASVYGRAKKHVKHQSVTGNIVIFDKSLVFVSDAPGESGSATGTPAPVRIPLADIASVDEGKFGLNRWIVVHTRDGHAQFFALSGSIGSPVVDRPKTLAAVQLLQSDLQLLGH